MGANDASGDGLQYALKNRHQNKIFFRLQLYETDYSCMLNSSCMKRHKAVIGLQIMLNCVR